MMDRSQIVSKGIIKFLSFGLCFLLLAGMIIQPVGASANLSNPFAKDQCVYTAYEYAAPVVQELIRWTQGKRFDGHPNPPSWVSWNAGKWVSNFLTYGPQYDNNYQWAEAVNSTPEVGAVIVWNGGSITRWTTTENGRDRVHEYTFSSYGHVGVVEAVDASTNTVTVRERNWGGNASTETLRPRTEITTGMSFIHAPQTTGANLPPENAPEVEQNMQVNFSTSIPLRNIWVISNSRFELRIDGNLILSQDRPASRTTFGQSRVWVGVNRNHTAEIRWWKKGDEAAPEFIQTWWPNQMAFAAEAEPTRAEVNYSVAFRPAQPQAGETVTFSISAANPLGMDVSSIDVLIDGTKVGSISGNLGTLEWNTQNIGSGDHGVEILANLSDWSGETASYSTSVNLGGDSSDSSSSNSNPPSVGNCSAEGMNAYLANSKMHDLGGVFLDRGKQYNVDPRFLIAISNAESSLGAHQCASYNAWGIMMPGTGTCRSFTSWDESISYVAGLVGRNYLPKGQNNIPSFVIRPSGTCTSHCYCASGCSNWVGNVGSAYSAMGGDPNTADLTLAACAGGTTPVNQNQPPNRPAPTEPYDWKVLNSSPVQLCAQTNGDPDGDAIAGYLFEIHDSAQNWSSGWVTGSCINTGTLGDYTYQWHVKVKDSRDAESEWSEDWHFTVQNAQVQPPDATTPTLSYPGDGISLPSDADITLTWNSATNATQYKVEVWGGSYGTMVPCDWQNSTSCHIGTMWPGTMEWHVRARNETGQETDWSDTWSFTIQENTPPPAADRPNLSSPGNGSSMPQTTDVTLVWNASANATQYKVEVWGGPYSTMVPCDWQNSTSCHIGTMWPGTMQWHVRARNETGQETDWSDTWSFTIQENTPPPAADRPNLSSPGNGSSMPQTTDVTLVWNASANATQYKVEVWGGPYSTMVPCDWQNSTSCHIGTMWPGTMQWHVRARNETGQETDWSDTWSFTIQEQQPEQIPGFVELGDDLSIRADPSGAWPPQSGDKLIAHIKIRNGGDTSIHIAHIGVRGRRNGSESWDIGFWTIDLGGHQEWSLDPNNERPLASGNYSFRISYSLDGSSWQEIGNEINFTVN